MIITIVLRGDSFRKPSLGVIPIPAKNLPCADDEMAVHFQKFTLDGIMKHIVNPFLSRGDTVNISGTLNKTGKEDFIQNYFKMRELNTNITHINRGNQNKSFKSAILKAQEDFQETDIFVISRTDQLYLKDIPCEKLTIDHIFFPNGQIYIKKYGLSAADQIHTIGKNCVHLFLDALKLTQLGNPHEIHSLLPMEKINSLFEKDLFRGNSLARKIHNKNMIDSDPFYIDLQRSGSDVIYEEKIKKLIEEFKPDKHFIQFLGF